MRSLPIGLLLAATLMPAAAEDWVTADGKTYANVTVQGQEQDGVRISYDGGVGKVPYYELPVDVQKRFGQDVDSLAAKRKAIDQAVESAVRTAAEAQLVTQNPPPRTPSPATTAPVPAGARTPVPPTPTNGTASVAPVPSAASVPAPAPPHPAAPTPTVTAAVPKPENATASSGAAKDIGASEKYPGATYTYNNALDVCYLDSPTVDLTPLTPHPNRKPSAGWSLMFRVVTDGSQAARPDRLEATFLSVGDPQRYATGSGAICFTIDDTPFRIADSARKDSGMLSGAGQGVEYISFYLTMEQARQIETAKKVNLSVSPDEFAVAGAGLTQLQNYLQLVEGLPPGPSSLLRNVYKMMAGLPSFFSALSVICEYLILGSFGLLLMAMVAAFVLGVTRFIKM